MEEGLRPPIAPRDETAATKLKATDKSSFKLWGSLVLLLVILLLVVWLLPSMVPDQLGQQPNAKPDVQTPVASEEPSMALQSDLIRSDAENALQDFLRLQAQPDLDNVEVWAVEAWQKAYDAAERGDDEFGQGNFIAALDGYRDAGRRLMDILNNREDTLQKSLEAGWRFLDENAVAEATAAFRRVLAMQADHQQAALGLERSTARERVLEFFMVAQQAEISEQLSLAVENYTFALQLDPLYLPAREALNKVESELRNRAFQGSLGRALQGIEQGRFTDAEQALSEASAIRPGDEAIKDARQRLLAARRQARLTAIRREAEQFEKSENWVASNDRYTQALKIDSQAAYARNGLSRSAEKIELHQQLDHYLADITRLYSDDPLNNARKLLSANQVTAANEPLLAEKLLKLEQAVNLAVIPVDLLIISDNLTEVTIYKVGRLGTFGEKRLSLRPGKYTITGSRQGYRDVLKVVELKPGVHGQSLDIRTGEQI